ncbi:MAG: cell division protein ZapA [Candidatus Babeliales bacterium]
MNKELKKYTVTILGEPFSLVTDEEQEHVVKAAALADSTLQEIKSQVSLADSRKVATLAILQLASKYIHLQDQQEKDNRIHQRLIEIIDQESLG